MENPGIRVAASDEAKQNNTEIIGFSSEISLKKLIQFPVQVMASLQLAVCSPLQQSICRQFQSGVQVGQLLTCQDREVVAAATVTRRTDYPLQV